MLKLNNTRQICVIEDTQYGKSTLTDALFDGTNNVSDSLTFSLELSDLKRESNQFCINFITMSDMSSTSYTSRGALLIIDASMSISSELEAMFREALTEYMEFILIINKIDRCILLQKLTSEELYQRFVTIISRCNAIVSEHRSINGYFDPKKGNVVFASSKHGWAFTVPQYAQLLVGFKKTNTSVTDCIERLWGDWFYSSFRKNWLSYKEAMEQSGEINLKRGFTTYIMESVCQLVHTCANLNIDLVKRILPHINVELPPEKLDKKKQDADNIIFNVMNTWLPIKDTILRMIVLHLPSPIQFNSENEQKQES